MNLPRARVSARRLLCIMAAQEAESPDLEGVDYDWDGAWSAAHQATGLDVPALWWVTRNVLECMVEQPAPEE